jgi:beta-glucosidase
MTKNELSSSQLLYLDPSAPVSARVEDLLARMTLEEKAGQMTQVEKNSIDPDTVGRLGIGSILSGGGGNPAANSPAAWLDMVSQYLDAARQSRLGIPLIYGVDAVHGHSNVYGATMFPHNIGLGATRDADLVRRIGRATAVETYATGVRWNFAPCIAVAASSQSPRRWPALPHGSGPQAVVWVASDSADSRPPPGGSAYNGRGT